MARCGCSGACNCVVQGDPACPTVTVTGAGTAENPYRICVAAEAAGLFQILDTNCINLTLTGTGVAGDPFVLSAAPIIDPDPANGLSCGASGLTVPLGTMAAQDADAVAITGGTISGVPITADTQAGTPYQLVLADSGKVVRMTNAGAAVLTVPTNATVAFPLGTIVNVYAAGAGGVTITPAGGVTVRNNGSALVQYQEVSLRKDATDEWVRVG